MIDGLSTGGTSKVILSNHATWENQTPRPMDCCLPDKSLRTQQDLAGPKTALQPERARCSQRRSAQGVTARNKRIVQACQSCHERKVACHYDINHAPTNTQKNTLDGVGDLTCKSCQKLGQECLPFKRTRLLGAGKGYGRWERVNDQQSKRSVTSSQLVTTAPKEDDVKDKPSNRSAYVRMGHRCAHCRRYKRRCTFPAIPAASSGNSNSCIRCLEGGISCVPWKTDDGQAVWVKM